MWNKEKTNLKIQAESTNSDQHLCSIAVFLNQMFYLTSLSKCKKLKSVLQKSGTLQFG